MYILYGLLLLAISNVAKADVLSNFELIGQGSCWKEGQQHPPDEQLSEIDNQPTTCAQACLDKYGENCGGFDTRAGCLIYKKLVESDQIVESKEDDLAWECYAIKYRDCSILAIDEFLLQCSVEFPAQADILTDLQNEVSGVNADMISKTTANTNSIASLQSEVNTIKHEIIVIETNSNDIQDLANMIAQIEQNMTNGAGQLSQEIVTIETTIMNAVNERLDAFAAKAPNANIDLVSNDNNSSSLLSLKDVLIIGLLIANVCLMWYSYFYNRGRKKQNTKQNYVAQYDEESDAENKQ